MKPEPFSLDSLSLGDLFAVISLEGLTLFHLFETPEGPGWYAMLAKRRPGASPLIVGSGEGTSASLALQSALARAREWSPPEAKPPPPPLRSIKFEDLDLDL